MESEDTKQSQQSQGPAIQKSRNPEIQLSCHVRHSFVIVHHISQRKTVKHSGIELEPEPEPGEDFAEKEINFTYFRGMFIKHQ